MTQSIRQPLTSPRIPAGDTAPAMHRTAPVPRTLEQAFGPYARRDQLVPMAESQAERRAEYERGHKVALLTGIAVGCVVALILFTEWLAL